MGDRELAVNNVTILLHNVGPWFAHCVPKSQLCYTRESSIITREAIGTDPADAGKADRWEEKKKLVVTPNTYLTLSGKSFDQFYNKQKFY
ncbi:uncharacterized protein [Chiloscyllium punctatum]|uniref:uncharacterized protein isoform X2 n=1 Tax=Chiloscyllium punctatum TaxID=137246 RepID=UPI003B637DDE